MIKDLVGVYTDLIDCVFVAMMCAGVRRIIHMGWVLHPCHTIAYISHYIFHAIAYNWKLSWKCNLHVQEKNMRVNLKYALMWLLHLSSMRHNPALLLSKLLVCYIAATSSYMHVNSKWTPQSIRHIPLHAWKFKVNFTFPRNDLQVTVAIAYNLKLNWKLKSAFPRKRLAGESEAKFAFPRNDMHVTL